MKYFFCDYNNILMFPWLKLIGIGHVFSLSSFHSANSISSASLAFNILSVSVIVWKQHLWPSKFNWKRISTVKFVSISSNNHVINAAHWIPFSLGVALVFREKKLLLAYIISCKKNSIQFSISFWMRRKLHFFTSFWVESEVVKGNTIVTRTGLHAWGAV